MSHDMALGSLSTKPSFIGGEVDPEDIELDCEGEDVQEDEILNLEVPVFDHKLIQRDTAGDNTSCENVPQEECTHNRHKVLKPIPEVDEDDSEEKSGKICRQAYKDCLKKCRSSLRRMDAKKGSCTPFLISADKLVRRIIVLRKSRNA